MTRDVAGDSNNPGPGPRGNYQEQARTWHEAHPTPSADDHSCNLSCQELRHQDYDPRCIKPYISQLWLKVVEHRIVPQKADSEECRDKGAAMTTGSSQQFHDFKIYNCSSKYTFSLVRLIYYQVKSSIYLEICLFSSFYLLLTPERSRGIVSVATYSVVTTT